MFPEKLPAHPPGGHQRVLLPSLTVALVLVAMPLLIWSVDTAVIRHAGHVSFGTYLLPTVTAAARDSDAAPAATAERIPDAVPAPVEVSPSPLSQAGGPAAAVEGVTGYGIAPAPGLESVAAPPMPSIAVPGWLSVELEKNFTSTLLSRWLEPGGEPCRDDRTTGVSIPGLDGSDVVELAAGPIHEFVIHALDDAGNRRCLGGDYFETDLSGASWKSRPPVKDNGNGSYTMRFQVHPDFAGDYNLTVVLLFRSFEGLKLSPERFAFRRELRSIPIRFYRATRRGGAAAPLPKLQLCRAADFQSRDVWSGRWTRHARNDNCDIDHDGRYRCLDPAFPCRKPWCRGHLGALESNGWVYSAHCSFALFKQDAAWRCLRGRWLFFWGDSNHVDTIRNLLNFVLGLPEVRAVPRRFDTNFTNPRNPSETVRITSLFNGHWNETMNYQGLYSLQHEGFRELVRRYFSEDDRVPDVVVLNSGLHDGVYWRNIRAFAGGADYAAKFWEDILADLRARGKPAPAVFYRTTIATGGYARDLAFNPHKMEAFNGVLLKKLRERGLLTGGVVDEFDMTFPWHWDNRCNDGVHYGRAPAKARWRDGQIGHQYFVDLMLAHVLLNAICGRP
ncbi:hypothetical protein Taro_022451 [Colocasia esculenta]|uniref:Uncharacterized protein n=1 Tax=Colocasia esculenta TaxID=4460 RepID=A0A843V1E5_COLES|nr:hypothetical protein [Colocasia esculenta]